MTHCIVLLYTITTACYSPAGQAMHCCKLSPLPKGRFRTLLPYLDPRLLWLPPWKEHWISIWRVWT